MADLFAGLPQVTQPAPVAPAQQGMPTRGVQQQGIADGWREWVHRPENAAALMQFGVALTQPLALGQSTLGSITNAAASGMQARDRSLADQQRQQNTAVEQEIARGTLEGKRKNWAALDAARGKTADAAMIAANKKGGAADKNMSWPAFAQYARLHPDPLSKPPTDAELYQLWKATQVAPAGTESSGSGTANVPPPMGSSTGVEDVTSPPTQGTPSDPNGTGQPVQQSSTGGIPSQSINLLRSRPDASTRAFFDERYGAGAAARILGN